MTHRAFADNTNRPVSRLQYVTILLEMEQHIDIPRKDDIRMYVESLSRQDTTSSLLTP